jgi:hypothetical protein
VIPLVTASEDGMSRGANRRPKEPEATEL